jgi:hypothetical protein
MQCEGVRWIQLAQNTLQWRGLVNTVMITRSGVLTAVTKNVTIYWDVLEVETAGPHKRRCSSFRGVG